MFHLQEVEVAKDAIDHKGNGQHHGVVRRQVGSGKGVQAVGDDGTAGNNQDELVEQRQEYTLPVTCGANWPLLPAGYSSARRFPIPKIQCQEGGEDVQPGREAMHD